MNFANVTGIQRLVAGIVLMAALAFPAHAQEQTNDGEAIWQTLEDSHWVQDGADDADTVVYTFTDPNCPYCDKFRDSAAPWIEAGEVQLRHIMVGILRQSSVPKAATILGSSNPSEALSRHQSAYESGGIKPDDELDKTARRQVAENTRLMQQLGARATPTTVYRDSDGEIAAKQGAPRPGEMPAIMGSPRPE